MHALSLVPTYLPILCVGDSVISANGCGRQEFIPTMNIAFSLQWPKAPLHNQPSSKCFKQAKGFAQAFFSDSGFNCAFKQLIPNDN